MKKHVVQTAALLTCSGACALIYQMCWLRELRLVFGASTLASSAVLAIFMGGLGLGGIVLGRRADRHPQPLAFYARLELCIACAAAVSPFLIMAVRWLYLSTGGSMVLGLPVATGLRLVLSALVLGVPTFLMGGTLPAAARFAEEDADPNRRHVAWLYGMNTLGAVLGAVFATFYMIEIFGTHGTLWMATLLNIAVAVVATGMARGYAQEPSADRETAPATGAAVEAQAPALFVLIAAGVVGFAFLLMELVWYRMLGPILGGSTYSFGLILTMALLGIGIGSAAYAALAQNLPARLSGFAVTAGLEALCIALPYALGDRIAVFSAIQWNMGALGFYGRITGWAMVTLIVVLPASIVAGFQFPMLIALLGRGREEVGRQTGLAYAWNCGGSILGSLAGGFLLLPLLSAVGAWRLVIVALGLLGVAAMLLSAVLERRHVRLAAPVLALSAAFLLVLLPLGPTAVWRHSGIGVGRPFVDVKNQGTLHQSENDIRRYTVWEAEGVESSVALSSAEGHALMVNGKSDGNARLDASTQVMLGLVSAILHPNPKSALVIGLGTGSSAGWLGKVESMERVDVVELEPTTREVARYCAPVNEDVLNNPKVNLIIGDGREIVLAAPKQYDLIASEPSNPYRAGIASLYTREFYRAALQRLAPGGIFTQWVQGYEIDDKTMLAIYATLNSVFPSVETWHTNTYDLLLVCSGAPAQYSADGLRKRLAQEPFKTALLRTWRTATLEEFLAHYVANGAFAQDIAPKNPYVQNTDDRCSIEFGFARTLGRQLSPLYNSLDDAARQRNLGRPVFTEGGVNWALVERQRVYEKVRSGEKSMGATDPGQMHRGAAFAASLQSDLARVLLEWQAQPETPLFPDERAMVLEAMANAGDAGITEHLAALAAEQPVEAEMIRGLLLYRQGKMTEAADALVDVFVQLRANPWPNVKMVTRALQLAQEIARRDNATAKALAGALREPFAVLVANEERRKAASTIAAFAGFDFARPFVEGFEPNVLWTPEFLRYRAECYNALGHPLAGLAASQLNDCLLGR